MENYLPWITAACSLGAAAACVVLLFAQKRGRIATEDLLMELLQQELSEQSEEALRRSSEMRRELNETLRASSMSLTESVRAIGDLLRYGGAGHNPYGLTWPHLLLGIHAGANPLNHIQLHGIFPGSPLYIHASDRVTVQR